MRIFVPTVKMASSRLLANFILSVKFLTCKAEVLTSTIFFPVENILFFLMHKTTTSLCLRVMGEQDFQA